MAIVVPLALLIVAYQYFTAVDRTSPTQVATAFTKALKSKDVKAAGKFFDPGGVEAWRDSFSGMRSGATDRFYERVPADPQFGAPTTNAKGITVVQSADQSYVLEMTQLNGKWYVSKAPS